jgi:DNA-binding transcriptional ArsR family regulator
VFLPASHAPAGGRLVARDLRKVTWTVEHPEDDRFVSPIEKRRGRVLRMVAEAVESGAIPSIDHLANALGVSESTVGRDLAELRRAGHVVSTRGHKDRAS